MTSVDLSSGEQTLSSYPHAGREDRGARSRRRQL
jgi:hypothetical protein